MKGTDHQGSLGPDGIFRMVRDIRNLEMSMGKKEMFMSGAVSDTKVKLERSVASKRFIKQGNTITEQDLHLLSPGDGFKWVYRDKVVGKVAATDIPENEIIYQKMIK